MSYKVRIESFEGPFDLLLHLVHRQRVDIGAISLADITDQYLAEIRRMQALDLEIASDFILVASTLLEIKAASLLPREVDEATGEDIEDYEPSDLRRILIERLINYKKFKNATAALERRFETETRMHERPFGPDASLFRLMPDYLRGVSVERIGELCAGVFSRQDIFLLESEHIAKRAIPVEVQIDHIYERLRHQRVAKFSDFIDKDTDAHVVVVTFLAILELFKQAKVSLRQDVLFGDIAISYLDQPEDDEGFGAIEEELEAVEAAETDAQDMVEEVDEEEPELA